MCGSLRRVQRHIGWRRAPFNPSREEGTANLLRGDNATESRRALRRRFVGEEEFDAGFASSRKLSEGQRPLFHQRRQMVDA
jgi:hypothetical protein